MYQNNLQSDSGSLLLFFYYLIYLCKNEIF